jgi:hypothetical protein
MQMTPIFEREFLVDGSGPIKISIYEPIQENEKWKCSYEIAWPDGVSEYQLFGSDKLQVFLFTLSVIESRLIAESERIGKKISYLGDERLGLIWHEWQRPGCEND